MDRAIEVASEHLKPEIVNDAIEALGGEMKSLGRSLGFRSWLKVKKTVKESFDDLDSKKRVTEYITKIMSSVKNKQNH